MRPALYWIVPVIVFATGPLFAEVVRDGTIGPDRSVQPTGPHFDIPDTLGELRGTNLFHSFDEFSLSKDQSATFSGIGAIDNIIARVTGPNSSTIDGLLRSTVDADLYFLNPHGILFGPNAQLDIKGAFHAGTAEQLEFSNGDVFAAAPSGVPPILSTAPPASFGFLGASAASIVLEGSALASRHDIAFSAGSIDLNKGATVSTATRDSAAGATITLTAANRIVFSGTNADSSGAGLDAGSQGDGGAGTVRVTAPVVELRDGARLSTDAEGAGNGGLVDIRAAERLTLSGRDNHDLSSSLQAQTQASGNAGMIQIHAGVIELQDGAQMSTLTQGSGSGGDLLLTATERITLAGKNRDGLGARLDAGTAASGNGGTVRVVAPIVELQNGAQIDVNTEGAGAGGHLSVTAAQRVKLSGTDDEGWGARLQANTNGAGAGGEIKVAAPIIELRDGATLQTNTGGRSTGRGGTLAVKASERVTLSGVDGNKFGSSLQAISNGSGAGGTLDVAAPVIELRDGARVTASSAGVGGPPSDSASPAPDPLDGPTPDNALTLTAGQSLVLSGRDEHGQGSRIETQALEQRDGRDISITAPVVQLTDGASISSSSVSTGRAGSIRVNAAQALQLSAGSTITSTGISASGGDITIEPGRFLLLQDSRISTSVGSGLGAAGDIVIAHDVVVLNASQITAQAAAGQGGHIRIHSDQLLASSTSLINDSAVPTGVDGDVVITAPESEFTREMARLRPRCDARGAQGAAGTFRVTQQQGLPLSPEDLLMTFDSMLVKPRPAVSASRDLVDSTDPADPAVLTTLAAAAFRAGRFEQAGDYWDQASARAQADGDPHAQGEALRGVAESQQVRGNYGASLETLGTALAQAETAQDNAGISAAQGLIGNAYLALGDTQTAERWLRDAIERAQAANEPARAAALLNNLGNQHRVAQRFAEALRAYEAAAQYAGDTDERAKALSNAARAALELGQSAQALELLKQARTVTRTLSAGHAKITVLIHLAKSAELFSAVMPPGLLDMSDMSSKRSHVAAAYSDLREAALLSHEANDLRSLSYALGNLGHLYQLDGRHEEALYLTRLAEQAADQARAPDALYRWHWQSGQLLWAQGESEAALQAYRRAVAILEDSRQETLAQYGAAHTRFRQAVAPVYNEFVDVLLQRAAQLGDGEAGTPLLLEARATVEQFKAAELRDYFRDECVAELEAKTTRLEAVSPHAAVIYPIVLPDRLELLVSVATGLKRYTVPVGDAALSTAIQRFRDVVETRDTEARVRVAGRALYGWLIEPFVAELGEIDTLVFVPGGLLRTVPFAALFDGEDYLIQRYRVVVTPGLALTDPRPFKRPVGKVVLAGLSESVQAFPALPDVSRELEFVQQMFGGRILLNEDFTTAHLKESLDEPVSIVHIASHAQFTGEAASSFLLTYDGRVSIDDLEQYLNVTRFREQPLELLVLSACQTAAGDERSALGLAGVGIKAGARSAVGSLWAITDAAAVEIVTEFYRQLKDPVVTKAQALQAAQRALLNSRHYAHPYYWSAYLLINNWL